VIDIQPETAVYETTIRLKHNETFEYSLLGLPVPRAINPPDGPLYYDFPPMPEGGHPGIAYQWLEISGPLDSTTWPPASHSVLFGELPIRAATSGDVPIELVSDHPREDAVRLLHRFLRLAEREPTSVETRSIYERLVLQQLDEGETLIEALLTAYGAFLCSPEFIYLREPAEVRSAETDNQYPIASRLSHFLGNTRPDNELMAYARNRSLLNIDILHAETQRWIEADSFDRFVVSFTDYWLSLKDVRRDEPDVRLYPEYRFDDYLIESMEAETRAFFKIMVRENMPVTALVDTDFVLINDRLARHYQVQSVWWHVDSGSHHEGDGQRHDDFTRDPGSVDHGSHSG